MSDPLKSFLSYADARRHAKLADAAAKAIAEHCDARINRSAEIIVDLVALAVGDIGGAEQRSKILAEAERFLAEEEEA